MVLIFNHTMERIAFKMKLKKGFEAEYERRHAAIWPAVARLLKKSGVKEYSIFLDKETCLLFACLKVAAINDLAAIREEQIMKDWWVYMKDLMEVNENNAPVRIDLREVFYLA